MTRLTSRERMLAALSLQRADHIPCCFMSFTALRQRCHEDMYALVRAERELGLDSMLFIPTAPRPMRPDHPDLRGLPVRFSPDVRLEEWREEGPDDAATLHKRYITPGGTLSTAVRLSEDWPHGNHIPFIGDYQVPRALKPLITMREELGALRYLLQPPGEDDVVRFRREAERAQHFAAEEGVLLAGGWGVGVDMACWLCGMENVMMLQMEQPDFLAELLQILHEWNVRRMEVVLSAPVDLFIKRAWYEGCDFITPRFYQQAILTQLKAEVALAHERGARFGYICSSGTTPMLDLYLEAGIDALIGVDPVQGSHTDMALMREMLGARVCLWGGVSGAITVEMGTEEEVRAAVRQAAAALGPTGFILSPVDNITVDAPTTWRNLKVFQDEWHRQWQLGPREPARG